MRASKQLTRIEIMKVLYSKVVLCRNHSCFQFKYFTDLGNSNLEKLTFKSPVVYTSISPTLCWELYVVLSCHQIPQDHQYEIICKEYLQFTK